VHVAAPHLASFALGAAAAASRVQWQLFLGLFLVAALFRIRTSLGVSGTMINGDTKLSKLGVLRGKGCVGSGEPNKKTLWTSNAL
jgi:hypothetical protein